MSDPQTPYMALTRDQSDDSVVVSTVTRIVREADAAFTKSGGTSRHWVRDWFLPLLNQSGLMVSALPPQATPCIGESAEEAFQANLDAEIGRLRVLIGRSVLDEIHDPWASGQYVATDESDVPENVRRELVRVSHEKAISLYYLLALYRQGAIDERKRHG